MTNAKRNQSINDGWRQIANENRVNWTPSTSIDPTDRQQDRQALNRALRRASGRDDPEPDNQGPFPWKSLGPDEAA